MRLSRKKSVKKNKTAKSKYVMKGGVPSQLMRFINNKQTNEALQLIQQLIQQNSNDVGVVDDRGYTALLFACNKQMSDIALALIKTGQSKPEHVTTSGNTALTVACNNEMTEVALALIKTGQSKPEQVTALGNTALSFACNNKMTEVALALIKTGQSKPEHVNSDGNTALLFACNNKMTEVALALIATKQSKPEQANTNGNTALILALKNEMIDVAFAIISTQPITLPNVSININSLKTFDIMDREDKLLPQFIAENNDNVIFIIDKKHCFNASKSKLLRELNGSIKFECLLVGDESLGENNINKNIKYCHIKKIANNLPIDFITYDDALQICNPLSGNIFQLTRSPKILTSSARVGSRYCPEGQGGAVYSVEKVIPDTSVAPAIIEEVAPTVVEKPNTSIRVEITNKTINTVEYSPTTTIQEVKENLFRQLDLSGSIDRIRLFYRGKILSNDQLISQIVGYNNSTDKLVGSIKPLSGGKQTRTKKRRKISKQKNKSKRKNKSKHKTKY